MAGIKSIAKAVMTQNHFVIAEAKLSREEKWTEVDRPQGRESLIKGSARKARDGDCICKKLTEIRNRGGGKGPGTKPSKN